MSKNIYTNTNLHTNIRMLIANGNINTPTDTRGILIKIVVWNTNIRPNIHTNTNANTNIHTSKLVLIFVSIPALVCFLALAFINITFNIKVICAYE